MKRKNFIQRMLAPLPELEQYYRELRKERFESGRLFGGVRTRRAIHSLLTVVIPYYHALCGRKLTVLGDKRVPSDRPLVFAANHICWHDIEMVFTAIKTHAYLFWGDPRELYRAFDGFALHVNGVVICDTNDANDRIVGKETCVKWLERGGNLLIFPEGAWNITENLPAMPFFPGTAEMALRTGADIIPVAVECYNETHFVVNIGENISTLNRDVSEKRALTDKLRDAVATLRWEIWESRPQTKRADLPPDIRARELEYVKRELRGVYTMDDLENDRFHTKEEAASREVAESFARLIPNPNNMFLFQKSR